MYSGFRGAKGFMQDTLFKAAFQRDAASAPSMAPAMSSARALMDLERFDEAAGALRRVLDAGLDGADAALAVRLEDLIGRRDALGEASPWPDFEAFILACVDAGLPRPAVAAWRQALALAGGPLAGARDDILDCAPAILRLADAAAVDALLLGLVAMLPWKPDGRALARTAKALRRLSLGLDAPPPAFEHANPMVRFMAGEACAAAGQWGMAIDAFSGVEGVGALRNLGSELARCVGRELLQAHPLVLVPPRAPKVFDLFPFNDEFGLLDFKLAEMGPWVDHFVIVEAARTFTGLPGRSISRRVATPTAHTATRSSTWSSTASPTA